MRQYFLLASAITLLTHLYFAARLFPASPAFRRALVANWLALPVAMVFTLRAPASMQPWAAALAHVTFFDVGLCVLVFVALALRDAVLAVAWVSAPSMRGTPTPRRLMLRRALDLAVVSVAGGVSVAGYGVALADPVVRRVRVPVDARHRLAGAPLRIVQVSDIHAGPTIRRGYVSSLVDAVNALDGDVVVITGDLVDGFVEQLADVVAPLARLRARHGVYFVTGNHEHYYRAPAWLDALRALGITALPNEYAMLRHGDAMVVLAGVDDPAAGEVDRHAALALAMSEAPADALRVLLAHRPADAHEAARRGFHLQLSGHLHGGQFLPLTWVMRWTEPFLAGLYRQGAMWLYVNRGAGYWGPPNRLGARQEITVLEVGA